MSFIRSVRLNPWRLFTSSSPEREAQATLRRAERQVMRDMVPAELRTTQGRMLGRLFKGTLPDLLHFGRSGSAEEESTETRISAGLVTDEETPDLLADAREQATAPGAVRRRRRGPATLPERSQRLEYVVRQIAGNGHVEYRANTIAVIRDPGLITRVMRWVAAMLLLIPHLIAQVLAWALRPRGKGRLKRRVVTVDRRGNIVVYRA